MAGKAEGKMAKKSGTTASDRGREAYSPTSAREDWEKNLPGVSTMFNPPPTHARQEKVVPEGGNATEGKQPEAPKTNATVGSGGDGGGGNGGDGDTKTEDVSAITKSAEFVRKKRSEDIKARLGKDHMVYYSIRYSNLRDSKADNLLGTQPTYLQGMARMVEMGDGRLLSGGLKMALTDKRVITMSVGMDWTCLRCEQHQVRPALRLRGEVGSGPSQAIVLVNQHFPSILPVKGAEQCLKIIRIENGATLDLVDELICLVGNRRIPPGSILMIMSVAHLARVGLSAYVADHLEAAGRIKDRFGKETRVSIRIQ
jgi:hypothetical protein